MARRGAATPPRKCYCAGKEAVMLFTILFAALALVAAPPASAGASAARPISPAAGARSDCPEATIHMTARPAPLVPRRLDELPPGRLELTVLREVDGCPIPAVLREGIGGPR